MANYVYVYTANKLPTKQDESHSELGAQKLYQAEEPTVITDIFLGARYLRQVPSLEFVETMASASDFIEAIKLLTNLLPALTQVIDLDPSDLRYAAEVIKKKRGKFLITDFTELSQEKNKDIEKIKKENLKYTTQAIMNTPRLKAYSSISKFSRQVKVLRKHLLKTKQHVIIGGFI
jgi:hypothetical protein